MATTMFISMWMNNTAATAMMSPITLAVLQELEGVSCIHFSYFRFNLAIKDIVFSKTFAKYITISQRIAKNRVGLQKLQSVTFWELRTQLRWAVVVQLLVRAPISH